ncbi:MAG TPA: hypothetical protein PKJ38_14475, partial [Planctomycetota bacterium]|nr:hypothetical protein [Planctomycetota bacterium]
MEPEGTQADQAGGAPSKAAPPRQGPSNAARPKGFSARGFVSVVTAGAFLALLATGAVRCWGRQRPSCAASPSTSSGCW